MKMLQIRNVPEDVHRRLKARAALAGTSLSEFALAELRRSLDRPTREELLERITARPRQQFAVSPSEIVRTARDKRART